MNPFKNIQNPSPLTRKNVVLLLLMYFVFYLFLFPIAMIVIDQLIIPGFLSMKYTDTIYHTLMTLAFLFMGSKLLQESNQHWNRKALYMPFIGAAVMIWGTFFIGIIIDLLSGQSESVNQALLMEQFQANRLPIMVQAMIFAPIVEEIIFRGVLYRHFKRAGRYLIPLIVSTLLFASMHSLVAILEGQWSDLWYIPLYAYMSLVLTYTYESTQNIYSSILLHFINNAIAIFAMLYALEHALN